MFIAIDKVTAVKMHGLIEKHWRNHVTRVEGELSERGRRGKSTGLWMTSLPG